MNESKLTGNGEGVALKALPENEQSRVSYWLSRLNSGHVRYVDLTLWRSSPGLD